MPPDAGGKFRRTPSEPIQGVVAEERLGQCEDDRGTYGGARHGQKGAEGRAKQEPACDGEKGRTRKREGDGHNVGKDIDEGREDDMLFHQCGQLAPVGPQRLKRQVRGETRGAHCKEQGGKGQDNPNTPVFKHRT